MYAAQASTLKTIDTECDTTRLPSLVNCWQVEEFSTGAGFASMLAEAD